MKLSKFQQRVLDKYLRPLSATSPDSILVIALNIYCSRLLCHNRIKIKTREHTVFPNLYSIVFAPSGSGKDRPLHYLNQVFKQTFDAFKEKYTIFHEAEVIRLTQEAEAKDMKVGQVKQFVKDNLSHRMRDSISDATPEGMASIGASFALANFGSIHYGNSEFLDYIQNKNQHNEGIINFLKDVYENGNYSMRALKGEKEFTEITGVPFTMLVHSSISGLLEDTKANQCLKDFLDRGLSRRSTVCYPDEDIIVETTTMEEKDALVEKALEFSESLSDEIMNVYSKTSSIFGKEIELSQDAHVLFHDYGRVNQEKRSKLSKYTPEAVGSELLDRHRKALRLSGILAAFDHPDDLTVRGEDYLIAVDQVEVFSSHFMRLIKRNAVSDIERVYDDIKRDQDEHTINRGYFRTLNYVSKNNAKKIIDQFIQELPEYCAEKDEVFVTDTKGNFKTYNIRSYKKKTPIQPITISVTDSDIPHPAYGWYKKTFSWAELEQTIKQKCYSGGVFNNGHRDSDDLIERGNVLLIDVDDNIPIDVAFEKVKGIHAMLIPTENHQKDKKGLTCDRYRIIIPTDKPVMPKHDFKNLMVNILNHLGLSGVDAGATGDAVRYFKPSPQDAHTLHTDATELLCWEAFDTLPPKNKPVVTKTIRSGKNDLPGQIFQTKEGTKTWADFKHLTLNDTTPVQCINPISHSNGDKTPSAFVGRHQTSGTLMFKCPVCGEIGFEPQDD